MISGTQLVQAACEIRYGLDALADALKQRHPEVHVHVHVNNGETVDPEAIADAIRFQVT